MKTHHIFALFLLFGFAAFAQPISIHAGSIDSIDRFDCAQLFFDTSDALLKNDKKPADIITDSRRKEIPPKAGKIYIVINVNVAEGRSLSVVDYKLAAGGETCNCIAITPEANEFYDTRRTVVQGPGRFRMLFSCPDTADTADLLPAAGLPLAEVKNIQLKENEKPAVQNAE